MRGASFDADGEGARHFLLQVAFFNDLGLLDADDMTYIWHSNFFTSADTVIGVNTPFSQQFGGTFFWVAVQPVSGSDITIYKIDVAAAAQFSTFLGRTVGVEFTTVDTIPASTWTQFGSTAQDAAGPAIDQEDGGLVFVIDLDSSATSVVFKWIEGQGVVWSTQTTQTQGLIRTQNWAQNSIITESRMGWIDSVEGAILIDTSDGSITTEADMTSTGLRVPQGAQFWDPNYEAIYVIQNGTVDGNVGIVGRVYLDRASGLGQTLSSIVTDLSERAGLTTGDLDVTELTDNVRGYVVGRQSSYRAAIEPLSTAFFFEAVESDNQIKFVKRGGSSVQTFSQSQLITLDDNGELVPETRTQEVELPERISIIYLDKEADYQQGTQSTKRIRQPRPAMYSRVEQAVQLPIVFTAQEAEQIAEKVLFSAWNERIAYRWRAPQQFLALDPTDIVTVNLDSGATLEVRLSKVTISQTLEVEFEALKESAVTFVSDTVADDLAGIPQKVNPPSENVQRFIFNVPLLRDVDDLGRSLSLVYFGGNAFTVNAFTSASLQRSADSGLSYEEIARALSGLDWGCAPTPSAP